jgi:D-arabinitol dehydrogenase (NADP+)
VSKPGPKLDLAVSMNLADHFISISDDDPQSNMNAIREANPHGFDIVVEATGAPSVLNQSIHYVRKGGTLVVYGVYDEAAKLAWPPMLIWANEITILASFCSTLKFPLVMEYLRTKKLDFRGIVNKTYRIEEWAEALAAVEKQTFVKAAIVFD